MNKRADNLFPLHDLVADRWSPRAFMDRSVPVESLRTILEAARWAPSCYNDQPWFFLVARREDGEEFDRMLSCLVEANRTWASKAPVLMLTVARTTFARNGKPNRHALHDVGLAVAGLTFQAADTGLAVHQMAGLDPARAVETYGIPEGHEVVTALAIGYPGDPDTLPEPLREREIEPRTRRLQGEFVFDGAWEKPAGW